VPSLESRLLNASLSVRSGSMAGAGPGDVQYCSDSVWESRIDSRDPVLGLLARRVLSNVRPIPPARGCDANRSLKGTTNMATRPWKIAYRAAALESNKALLEKRITVAQDVLMT